jgi:predicted O-linked N-acetylglucosamine transferase (SPINDLY family)
MPPSGWRPSGIFRPAGAGGKAIDYIFADPVAIPAGERALLREQVIALQNFLGHWSPDPSPRPQPLQAPSRGYVTFGSFGSARGAAKLWAILRAVPETRLVLKDRLIDRASQQEPILAARGGRRRAVTILNQENHAAHFAAYGDLDCARSFPHSGV